MKKLTIIAIATSCLAVVASEAHASRNDSYPELPIPVKECPHWFDIRTEYVANNFVNEKYQVRKPYHLFSKWWLTQSNKKIGILVRACKARCHSTTQPNLRLHNFWLAYFARVGERDWGRSGKRWKMIYIQCYGTEGTKTAFSSYLGCSWCIHPSMSENWKQSGHWLFHELNHRVIRRSSRLLYRNMACTRKSPKWKNIALTLFMYIWFQGDPWRRRKLQRSRRSHRRPPLLPEEQQLCGHDRLPRSNGRRKWRGSIWEFNPIPMSREWRWHCLHSPQLPHQNPNNNWWAFRAHVPGCNRSWVGMGYGMGHRDPSSGPWRLYLPNGRDRWNSRGVAKWTSGRFFMS